MAASKDAGPNSNISRWRDAMVSTLQPLLSLLAIVVIFALLDHRWGHGGFLTVYNLRVVLTTAAVVVVPALGMTIIIIAGGIDLSAGTAVSLCATLLALCLKHVPPIALGIVGIEWFVVVIQPFVIGILATLLMGCLCGFFSGSLISLLRVVPFIVTLGGMTIFLGIGQIISDGTTIYPDRATQIPQWMIAWCSTRKPDVIWGFVPNLPPGVLFAGILALVVACILRFSVFGRYVFALGSNESTARLCGINIPVMKTAVYVVAGIFVALGGLYHFAVVKNGTPTDGVGLELQVIAAVVIGGGSLNGGRGSVLGTMVGACVMAVIRSGCGSLNVPNHYEKIIIGAVIIVAVAFDEFRQRRLNT